MNPDLSLINPLLHEQALRGLREGDVGPFFDSTDSNGSMLLFMRNVGMFQQRGLFEKALLSAWSNQKHNFVFFGDEKYRWDSFLRDRLLECNREKLMECSDALPEGEMLTVYRGVSGKGRMRALRGISWSLSMDVARFFGRYGFRPALYRTTVKRSDVFAYINESGRNEQEVLLLLDKKHPVERVK